MKFTISRKRKRQTIGLLAGLALSLVALTVLMLPSNEDLVSLGPMNTGHEDLECIDCHLKAQGTAMQQLQTNFMYFIGQRKTPVDFGHYDVDRTKCLACHERPNDRHPVHRFEEPRFADARKAIMPTKCESCHMEHQGVRLTINTTGFCVNCHADLEMTDDPLDIPHVTLIQQEQWSTCLQCHDFHGNHQMKAATAMKDTIPLEKIKAYFAGMEDPYDAEKKHAATRTPLKKQKKNK